MEGYVIGAIALMIGGLYMKFRSMQKRAAQLEREKRRNDMKRNIEKYQDEIDEGVKRAKKSKEKFHKLRDDFNDKYKH